MSTLCVFMFCLTWFCPYRRVKKISGGFMLTNVQTPSRTVVHPPIPPPLLPPAGMIFRWYTRNVR